MFGVGIIPSFLGVRANSETVFSDGVGLVFGFTFSKLLAFYKLIFNALRLN